MQRPSPLLGFEVCPTLVVGFHIQCFSNSLYYFNGSLGSESMKNATILKNQLKKMTVIKSFQNGIKSFHYYPDGRSLFDIFVVCFILIYCGQVILGIFFSIFRFT